MCTNEKAKQTLLHHLPVPLWYTSKVIRRSHNPRFICSKHMQIPSNSVVQTCDDFEILMHTSKGEQINFKFLFIQFTCWLVR